jgi:hypothetical protein
LKRDVTKSRVVGPIIFCATALLLAHYVFHRGATLWAVVIGAAAGGIVDRMIVTMQRRSGSRS